MATDLIALPYPAIAAGACSAPDPELYRAAHRLVRAAEATRKDGERRELVVGALRLRVERVQTAQSELSGSHGAQLTARERDVARLVCRGLQNREVAVRLGVTQNTVKRHLYNIYNKIGVDSRMQLANELRSTVLDGRRATP